MPVASLTTSRIPARTMSVCPHCHVQGVIREYTLLKAFQKGIEDCGYMIVAPTGNESAPPASIMNHVVRMLRQKGFKVV